MDIVLEVNKLDSIEKLSVYMHYYIKMLGLKYFPSTADLHIQGITYDNLQTLYPIKYQWKDIFIYSFNEFISAERIEVRDLGEKWKENGFAQKHWTVYTGIYDWYSKFKDEIKLS